MQGDNLFYREQHNLPVPLEMDFMVVSFEEEDLAVLQIHFENRIRLNA